MLDGGEDGGVLELGEGTVEDGGDECGDHLGAAQGALVVGFVVGAGPVGEGVEAGGAAGGEADDVETEELGERGVLALGVGDGDPAAVGAGAVDGGHAPQQRLDERGLAVAGLAEDPAVGVGDRPGGVGLEGVPAELGAAGEEVEADVGPSVAEGALDGERVEAGDVGGRAAVQGSRSGGRMVASVQARRVRGARPSGRAAAQPRSWRASRQRSSMPDFAGELLDDLAVLLELVEVGGADGDEAGVAHLGVAGDELLLAVEERLGGSAVAGVDAAALLLLGVGVGLELDEVAFDPAAGLVGRDRA